LRIFEYFVQSLLLLDDEEVNTNQLAVFKSVIMNMLSGLRASG